MKIGRQNADFMSYFPNIFFKKDPPREFFWRIFEKLFPEDYRQNYQQNMDRIQRRISKPQVIRINPEQLRIMRIQKQDNIKLNLALGKPRLSHNVTYLRKTRAEPVRQGPIDCYLNPPRQNQDQIFHDDLED